MKHLQQILGIGLILLLAACGGGGGGGGTKPVINSFTATPSSLPTGGGSTTLAWNVTGATTLSIDQGIGAVTPVTSGSTSKSITATTTFTLTATNASGSVTQPVAVTVAAPPSTITVSGKVVGINLQPAASVPVVISGQAPVTTDANGNFTVSGVTTPYDATVVVGAQKLGLVYKGLTRSDPTLFFFNFTPGTNNTATLSGTISGGDGFPQPATDRSNVVFGSPEASRTFTPNTTTGAYGPSSVTWFGPASTTGTIYALQWQVDGAGLPVAYKGFGSKASVTLSNGGTFAGQNVTMGSVAGSSISGSVSTPSGYTLLSKSLSVNFATNAILGLLNDSTSATSFTYITPNISGATLQLQASAQKAAISTVLGFKPGLAANASGVSLTLPAGPELSLPVNAATGVTTSTNFTWTPFSGGVHLVLILGPAGQPKYYILTTGSNATIPDLTSLGLGLPTATNYSWAVYGFAPFASIDAAAGANGFLGGLTGSITGDTFVGVSGAFTFTTAP